MNCITYARVSTERQAEKDLSIPAQLSAMREYAQRQGWAVTEEFTEPGASARTAERPALQRMLARCKREPRVDVVLVHKIDRLARNVYDHATIKALLKHRSIRLASVVENMDDSVAGQLVENIMASIADFYSANLGEEVKKGMNAKVARGEWPHKPPLGYRFIRGPDGRSKVEPHPLTGPLMRQAFALYAGGFYSIKQLAREMAAKGLLTRLGKPLASSQMNLLLRNPFFSGRLSWKGEVHPGAHEPLVDRETFDRVQRHLSAKSVRGATRYGSLEFWLKGIAHCGACGTKMTAERHKGHAYYRCLANARSRELCGASFSNAEKVHETLERIYHTLTFAGDANRRLVDAAEAQVRNRFSTIMYRSRESVVMSRTKLLERQLKTAEAYAAGDLSRHVYLALTDRLGRQLAGLEDQILSMSVEPEAIIGGLRESLLAAHSLWDLHRALRPSSRAGLTHAVFERVLISSGRIESARLRHTLSGLFEDEPPTTPSGGSEPSSDGIEQLAAVITGDADGSKPTTAGSLGMAESGNPADLDLRGRAALPVWPARL